MHRLFNQASEITHDIIGSSIEVHKDKGPGLLEKCDFRPKGLALRQPGVERCAMK